MRLYPKSITQIQKLDEKENLQQEWQQSWVRLSIVFLSLLYFSSIDSTGGVIISSLYLLISLLNLFLIWLTPHHGLWRRYFFFTFDLLLCSLVAVLGESAQLYIAVLLWVIIGYGIRFGIQYLLLGSVSGFSLTLLLYLYNDFWRNHSTLIAINLSLLLLIPVYMFVLLRKNDRYRAVKTRFLANLGHEVRTPLSGILGVIDMLLAKESDPETHRHLRSIKRSADSLLLSMNNLLNYSAFEQRTTGPTDVHQFSVPMLLAVIDNTFSYSITLKGIEYISIDDTPSGMMVEGNYQAIQQILLNIVSNATKYTNHGRITLKASIAHTSGTHERVTIRFEVSDTGIGIPHKYHKQVFQAFQRVETNNHASQSSGLGMAISSALAESINASIYFDSVPNQGTTFFLDVPLKVAGSQVPMEVRSEPSFSTAGKNILVIDDTSVVRAVISSILKKSGFNVLQAENGAQALEIAEKQHIDLAVIDMHMPHLSGTEVARRLRKTILDRRLPVILLSADDTDNAKRLVHHSEIDIFLQKPVDNELLIHSVSSLLTLEQKNDDEKHNVVDPAIMNNIQSINPDPMFYRSLVDDFCKEAKEVLESMTASLAKKDWEQIRAHAHAIKGMSYTVGASKVIQSSIEINLSDNDHLDMQGEQLIKKCHNHIQEFLKYTLNP